MALIVETVTIAVPCYNAGRYIAAVLEALLAQTRPADAILVVDDGSTDDTLAIVRRYPQVRLLQHNGNQGLAAARNTMIAACQSDILVMVDSDAYADPEFLAGLLRGYTDESVAGVGGKAIEAVQRHPADVWRAEHQFAQHWGDEPVPTAPFLPGLCCSYRLEVLRELGGFDLAHTTNGEDVDIGVRLRQRGYRLVYRPDAIVRHQREDAYASVGRMVYRYCKGGMLGLMRHREEGLDFGLFCLLRHLKQNVRRDLIERRDLRQFGLSLWAAGLEGWGYVDAARELGRVWR